MESNYRISGVQVVRLGSKDVKLFSAYKLDGDAFVYVGRFSAPMKTARKDLWKYVEGVVQ